MLIAVTVPHQFENCYTILPYSLTDCSSHIAYLPERFDRPSNRDLEHTRQTLETLRKLF